MNMSLSLKFRTSQPTNSRRKLSNVQFKKVYFCLYLRQTNALILFCGSFQKITTCTSARAQATCESADARETLMLEEASLIFWVLFFYKKLHAIHFLVLMQQHRLEASVSSSSRFVFVLQSRHIFHVFALSQSFLPPTPPSSSSSSFSSSLQKCHSGSSAHGEYC